MPSYASFHLQYFSSPLLSRIYVPSNSASWHTEVHIWNLLNTTAPHYWESISLITEKKKNLHKLSLTYPITIIYHWSSLYNSCLLPTELHNLPLHNFLTSLLSWHMLQVCWIVLPPLFFPGKLLLIFQELLGSFFRFPQIISPQTFQGASCMISTIQCCITLFAFISSNRL